jgi:PPP family 3-phenylpropionic acid transporter
LNDLKQSNKTYFYFIMLYAFTYMGNAIYFTYMPVYLNQIGFAQTAIETLLSLGPFVSIIAQPVWGMAGDRAKSKLSILKILLLGSGIAVLFYPASTAFAYLFLLMALFAFFQMPINSMCDAVTLEYLEKTRWKFGPIRMAGTMGFAVMAVAAGAVAELNILGIFLLYSLIAGIAFLVTFRLPSVRGHQSGREKVPLWQLFRNGPLMIMMSFNLIIQITIGFYYSFFSIYYRQMGADHSLIGWAMFISAASELPFLFLADRIIKRVKIPYIFIASSAAAALRWFLMYRVQHPYWVLPIQTLHGLIFIVLVFTLATYINREVPKELKASGQTLNGLVTLGLARIIGSLLGGALSERIGIRQVFLWNALLVLLTMLIYGGFFIWQERKRKKERA